MRAKTIAPALIALYALATIAAVAEHAPAALRTPLALPLVLILPGWAVCAALGWPGGRGTAERLTVAVGASLAIAAVGAVVLNLTPWGVRAVPWTVLLAGVTFAGAVVALARERTALPARRSMLLRPSPAQGSLFALAAGIVALAGVVAWQGALRQTTPGFTQFWLEQGARYDSVDVGVTNHEHTRLTYRVLISDGDQVLATAGPFDLDDGATWQQTLVIASETPGRPLTAALYRLDQPNQPYRQTTLWPPAPPSPAKAQEAQ